MPALFVGHGAPTNVIEDTPWSRGFTAMGATIAKPRAILCISAHWFVPGVRITGSATPRTIHDFGGFPKAMYELRYPAPGHLGLAGKVRKLIGEERARLDNAWGFDHGTWCVLKRMYPEASIPVIQLSVDRTLSGNQHFALAQHLCELRDDGVLVLGSGNATHNLRDAIMRFSGRMPSTTPDWARAFDREVQQRCDQRAWNQLATLQETSAHGRAAHPTPDHYLPLVYIAAIAGETEPVTYPLTGWEGGSISMRSVCVG